MTIKDHIQKHLSQEIQAIISLVIIIALVYVWWDTRDTQNTADNNDAQVATLAERVTVLEENFKVLSEDNVNLSNALQEATDVADSVKKELKKIDSSVDDLEKLSKIDPQLLQKYSKVYFLNEHYVPSGLSTIDSEFTIGGKQIQIHSKVAKHLNKLLEDAKDDGLSLRVVSGYRSFDTQKDLKSNYSVIYGAGTANTFSADQGYSEHQLGTTVDFTTPAIAGTATSFDQTPEFAWLQKNANEYGFVLSYPKGNAYYMYEPWHWRFVSRDLAEELYDIKKGFYDLDQREIDRYLADFFD